VAVQTTRRGAAQSPRASPFEAVLDRLARRVGSYRWVACWQEEVTWAVRAPQALARDEIYVRLAPGLASASGFGVARTSDLGDLGARLGVAGVSHILTVGTGQDPLGCVLAFENPDEARLRALVAADGVLELAELAPLAGQLLRTERWAGELFTFLDWLAEVAGMAGAGEVEALEALARLAGQKGALALAPSPRGISVTAAWEGEGGWRHHQGSVPESAWDEGWRDPGAAAREAARISGMGDFATWAVSRTLAFEPEVIVALAGGPSLPSPRGMELFATGVARTVADRRLEATARRISLLRERSRLASMTHEGITQVLTNVAIQLEVLDQVLEDPATARGMIRSSRTAVLEALDSIRGAVFEIAPAVPEWGDLANGLRRYAADFGAQWGLDVSYSVEGPAREVSADVLALAFAFVQEGLTNLRRHAHTTEGEVTLRFEPTGLSLSVCDRGVGFDRSDRQEHGFREQRGLALTEARAKLLGGRFEVRSSPGHGTCISLRITG
jgi:signal transduction histidine kinase